MQFKDTKKAELLEYLKSDTAISFYHLVKIDLSGGYGRSEFVRGESQFEDKQGIYETWVQGLYHLPEEERSFISIVYNEFKTKYSIHVITSLIEESEDPFVKIGIENRDVFLEIGLHQLRNENKISISDKPVAVGELDEFINSITKDSNFQSAVYSDKLRKELTEKAEFVISKIQLSGHEHTERHLKNIISRLLKFLYPTSWNKKLQFSVFIIPGYAPTGLNEQTSGGAVAFFNPDGFTNSFKEKIETISSKTALWSNLETVDSLLHLSESQSRRAAIAQVMARNMSHNIGSHVLNKVYKVLIDSQDEDDLKRAAHLFEFIQKRMEFIANGVNASFQSRHFLFKEILPAYLQEPEEKRLNLKSLFDNISGNQLITSENIFFRINEGIQDIQVSIPNGTLGFHALYTLFENIIRNSVKHNLSYPTANKLVYTIKVEQNTNGEYSDYYKVIVTDNFGEINEQKGLKVISLNSNMNQPILSNGSLRPNYWGLLEMRICATYLLGLPIDLIDSANKLTGNEIEINGIKQSFPTALLISQDSDKNLVHTFYLQKPKVAAVIGNRFRQNETEGIELVTSRQEFDKIGSKHLFAVFENENAAKEHETKTNQRSIFNSEKATEKTSVNENVLWNKFAEQKGWNVDDVEVVNIIDYSNEGSLFPIKPNKRYIIFDHHQDWWEKQENKNLIISESKNFLYYEYVNSLSPTTTAITKPIQLNNGVPDSVLKIKIFETAFTDIIVLDERIQKNYGQSKLTLTNPQSENPLFSNLFIPPYEGETDLDKATTKNILEWEKSISTFKKDYKLNYLIIHRSITGKDRIDIDELENELRPDFTIFVSGGGTPPNLKDGEFYLPFDVLNYCLGSNPSKFALVGILKSLRKIKK